MNTNIKKKLTGKVTSVTGGRSSTSTTARPDSTTQDKDFAHRVRVNETKPRSDAAKAFVDGNGSVSKVTDFRLLHKCHRDWSAS
jgi:hypothetical protein